MTGGTVSFGAGGTGSSGTYAGTGFASGDGYRRVYSVISYPTGNPATPSGNPVSIDSISISGSISCANGYGFEFPSNGNGTGNVGIYYVPTAQLNFQRFIGNGGTVYDSADGTSFGSAGSGGLQGSYVWSTVPGAAGTTTATASTVSSGVIQLSWTAATDTGNSTITGYNIYIGTSTTPTKTVGNVTSSYVSGLSPGTSYTFRVAAVNKNGAGARGTASASVAAPLIAPPIEQVTANINGDWRSYRNIYAKINNAWRSITYGWAKISGVWRQFHGPSFSIAAVGGQSGGGGSSWYSAWAWDNTTGFNNASKNSAASISGIPYSINFSKDGSYVGIGTNTSPYVYFYPWTQTSSSFGAKYTDPASLPGGTANSIAFAPSNQVVATCHSGGGVNVRLYNFGSSGATTLQTSLSLGSVTPQSVFWRNDSSFLGVTGSSGTVDVGVYSWNGSSLGTKISASGFLTKTYYSGTFSNNGNIVAAGNGDTPFVQAWPWSNSTYFGTAFTNPGTIPTGQGNSVRFAKSGKFLAVAHSTTPFVSVYQWDDSTGFGSKYTDPATLPTGTSNGVFFSTDDYNIVVAHNTTPYISAYPWSSGFGTKFTNPTSLGTGNGIDAAFS